MRNFIIVSLYTIIEMLKKKTFLISNLILIIMIVIGFNIPNILNVLNEEDERMIYKMLVVDSEDVFEGTLETLNDMELEYVYEIVNDKLEYEDIKEKMDKIEITDALVITKKDEVINLEYIVRNTAIVSELPEECVDALTTIYSNLQLSKLGLTQVQIQNIQPVFNFEIKQTQYEEVNGNMIAIMLLSVVLFYAIYFCAYQVSSAITIEKTSKIIETLVTSTKPRTIVLGKTIGIGIVGLIQVVVLVLVAIFCAQTFLPEGTLENIFDLSQMTPFLAGMTIIYFLLGYLVFALLYALTGSTVSKPEDVQSANGPVAIISIIGFYLAYFTMMNPTSELNEFASIFPFSSPFCMPFRIMMGVATSSQIMWSIIVLVALTLIIAQISIKIYSNAILNYGSKMSLKDMVKMYFQK